jgi:recombination associated protein RdgC
MWFKNLRLYGLTDSLPCEPEALEEALATRVFEPCAGLDTQRIGWVPPIDPAAQALVHEHAGFVLLCARTQQRLLPAATIREALDEKMLAIERRDGRKPGRRERAEMKDEIVQTLLPRALTRSQHTRAVLSLRSNLLLVDAAAPARAEDLLNLLRESLGSLPVRPLTPKRNAAELMTRWLNGTRLPKHFRLGQHCDLRDPMHQANVVRCRAQELATREVRNHLEAGKQAVAIGLAWNERLQFVLAEDLGLRAIRYEDVSERDAGADADVDGTARQEADFVFMALELDRLAAELVEVFGWADGP